MGLKIKDTIRTHQIGPKTELTLAAIAFSTELVEQELKNVRTAHSILTTMDEHGTRGGSRKVADREYRKAQRRYEAVCRLKYLAMVDHDHLIVIRGEMVTHDASQSPVDASGEPQYDEVTINIPRQVDKVMVYAKPAGSDGAGY